MSVITKEPSYFIEEINWSKGIDWYETLFPEPAKIIGESSTNYTKYPLYTGVPEKMHKTIPNAKLLYLVRDPVDQMVSHYMESFSGRWTNQSFEEAFADLKDNYFVKCAMYFMQIEQYLKYYPPDRIFVIDSNDLRTDRMKTLKHIFRFLEVNPEFEHEGYNIEHNPSITKRVENRLGRIILPIPVLSRLRGMIPSLFYKPVPRPAMTEPLRSALTELVREDVEKLRAFTGQKFSSWSI